MRMVRTGQFDMSQNLQDTRFHHILNLRVESDTMKKVKNQATMNESHSSKKLYWDLKMEM